ncbi:RNA polymerase-associated protein RapA [Porticoccus sp. W117]|uniref:RNA polymerase-associated protein RapA n=1 Tax=Porticoccus sp. W117 TaxID=3054777 RepID=UPI002596A203|nr:RNA polymerase-associated protein RapA [Porticoccus sp. W117]MDM3869886.1 RNA polymerase-associated protein RapA [Porticoccus sp. W117]
MSNSRFIPGQRWVSNTESDAGLGIVVEAGNRRVTVSFPAIGEQRTYAADNAPLSRVLYNVGDRIRSADGDLLDVLEVREEGGYITYLGRDQSGNEQCLEELELDSFVQFSKPQDRLFAGQIDKLSRFELRQQTLAHNHRHQQSPALGLLGARVQLLPHQLYIGHEVANRHAPRVLLADEVGLGKTIEAGLIIHQQLVSGRASRVLVVVPDSLVHQWLVEMLRRFNLMFTILDEERCQALTGECDGDEDGAVDDQINPFESAQLVLCNLSFLTNSEQRLQQAADASWDLMVVDEAHHLQWSEQQASPEYQCIETLAKAVTGLLLLTATPEQLGIESHFARLRLLDPDRYYDLQKFCDEESDYQRVSELVEQLTASDSAEKLRQSSLLKRELDHYLGNQADDLLAALNTDSEDDKQHVMDELVHSLLDRHGTGRVLFRNTRDGVAGFPERRLNPYKLAVPTEYLNRLDGADLEQRLKPEQLLGEGWLAHDPRVKWLADWLADNRDQKVLVICAQASTAEQLEGHLNVRCGVRSALFHEGMSLVQRDRAAAYFADEDESAQALICSEIGSEGRNFQFARHLVMFDLPLNPDLLEQRIGRLDRIGQRHCVQIHVPFYDNSPQFTLLRWYHDGLNAFERVCPVASAVHTQFGDQLRACLLAEKTDVDSLVANARVATDAALYEFQQGRDRLLEISSCHPQKAEQVVEQLVEAESPRQLEAYMEQVFDQYGVEHNHHSLDALVLEPGDHMAVERFPGLLDDGMTVTFNRHKALSREEMHFLSWEHPMVAGAMEMILGSDFGNTALCTLKLPPLKPGTLLLETTFTLHCSAPKALQVQRYLPVSSLRVVVDSNGRDLSGVLTPDHLQRLGKKVAIATAQELVRQVRPQINELIEQAQTLAGKQQGGLVESALEKMQRLQKRELQRLQALAEANPNIRQEEIEHIRDTSEQLAGYLEAAELRLDSLRVVVTV